MDQPVRRIKNGSVYMDFTYAEYLENWERQFDDAEAGNYGYYRRGEYVPVTVARLSPEEFQDHVKLLAEADRRFERALEADDPDGMDVALEDGFPHELALLI